MATMPPSPESLLAHGDFLRGLARSLLGDHHAAEDVVQQSYLRALSARPDERGLRRWLATAVRRIAGNERRASARRARREQASTPRPAVPSAQEIAAREELRRRVVETVLGLAEPYQSAIVLRYFESLSPAEIAVRLGISASTVRSRLHRAEAMLRQRLDAADAVEPAGQKGWAALLVPLARPLPPLYPPVVVAPQTTPALTWIALVIQKTTLGTVCVVAAGAIAVTAWFSFSSTSAAPPDNVASPSRVAPQPASVAADPARSETTVPLARAATVPGSPAGAGPVELSASYRAALAGFRGRVVDADGAPVAGCGVSLFRLAADSLLQPSAHGIAPRLVAATGTSGGDGTFALEGVPPRGLFVMQLVSATGAHTTRIVPRAPEPGQTVDLGDVPLAQLGVVRGVVVDEQDAPVPGARVLALDLPFAYLAMLPLHAFDPEGALIASRGRVPVAVLDVPAWLPALCDDLPIPHTTTAADGSFELAGVPPGPTALGIAARGHAPLLRANLRVAAGAPRDVGRLQLSAGELVAGVVRDTTGEPVSGAEVLVAAASAVAPVHCAGPALRTDEGGGFATRGLPRGNVVLAARRGPGHSWTVTDPQPTADDVTITLPAGHSITLEITSRGGGELPAPHCELFPGHGAGTPDLAALGLVRPLDLGGRLQRSGNRLEIADLEPGAYTVVVAATGYVTARRPLDFSGDTSLRIVLQPRRPLSLHTVDARGEPVAGASVHVRPTDPDWPMALPYPAGSTGADGSLSLDDVAGDLVYIRASHPAFGVVERRIARADEGTQVVLVFAATGAVDGVLHKAGRPAELGAWSVSLQPDGVTSDPDILPAIPQIAQPDDRGRFVFPALQPGRYRLTAIAALDRGPLGSTLSPGRLLAQGKFAWLPSTRGATVEVLAGQTAHCRIDTADPAGAAPAEPSARITGSVLIDGEPAADIMLLAELGPDRKPMFATSKHDGRFDLGQVPVGRRFLFAFDVEQRTMADNQPHMLWSQWVDLEDGRSQDLTIEVRTASLAGTVTGQDGAPLADALVVATGELASPGRGAGEDEPVRTVHVAKSDAAGRFSIPRVAPGRWSLAVRAIGTAKVSGRLDALELIAGEHRDGLHLHCAR